jgi:hypothetical protein
VGRLTREKQEWEQEKQRLLAQVGSSIISRTNGNISPAPTLFSRIIKMDPQPLYEKIKQTYPERDLSSLDSVMEALRWMLQTNNIKLRPPENVFLDDRTGNLIVRSSMTNMEAIELFIQKVNTGL